MKRFLKLFTIGLLVVCFCLSACGCASLDKMKKERASWNNNGDIVWNNAVYIYTCEIEKIKNFSFISDSNIFVSTIDVPVLLSNIRSEQYNVGYNKKLLFNDFNIYCREDYLNDFKEIINSKKLDEVYAFDYSSCYYYDDDIEKNCYKKLDAEGFSKLQKYLEKAKPLTTGFWPDEYAPYAMILLCSKDLIISKSIYELTVNNGSVYLTTFSDEENIDEPETNETKVYKIPEKYTYIFKDLESFKNQQ